MELEFDGFEGGEDEQYSIWNKQLKRHERNVVLDEIDAIIAAEDYDLEDEESY